jgi:predicted site-specific integrase-resolvase
MAQTMNPETAATTVDEFCQAHRISRASFYNYLKAGLGPVIMKVGGRTLVSNEAAAAWRRRMEAQTAKVAA